MMIKIIFKSQMQLLFPSCMLQDDGEGYRCILPPSPSLPAGICPHRRFQMLRAAKLKEKTVDFTQWTTESKELTAAVKPHASLFSYRGSRKEGPTQYGSYIHVWLGFLIKPKASYDMQHSVKPEDIHQEEAETIHQLPDSDRKGSRQNDLVIRSSHAEFMHHSPLQNDGDERKDSTRTSCYCKSFTWYRRWEASKPH